MDNENIKARVTGFTKNSENVSRQISIAALNIQNLIDKYGETNEILNVVRDFYQRKIQEFELLLIIYIDIVNSTDFKRFEESLIPAYESLKNQIEEYILEAKEDLAKVAKKKINKINKPVSTRSLLKKIRL
jgi:hypothetical protein